MRWILSDRQTPIFCKANFVIQYRVIMRFRCLQILYFKGIDSGRLPYVKHADVIIYAIATALIFHVVGFSLHSELIVNFIFV